MKLKEEGSYNDISSNIKYHLIYPSPSSGFNSTTNIRRPNSQYEKFGNLKIKSEEPEQKNRKRFPKIFTSDPNNTANLYLNKNNYTFKKKNKPKKSYYEKEQLFERVLNLQNAVNSLNLKNNKLKVENGKQSKEIEKQNKLLNMINVKNLKDKRSFSKPNINLYSLNKYKNSYLFLNMDEQEEKDKKSLIKKEYESIYDIQSNENSAKISEINKKDKSKFYKEKYKLPKDISYDKLKDLYISLFNQFEQAIKNLNYAENENAQLREEIDNIQISNETLLSNLKMQCTYLEKENESKKNEIEALKKSAKFSKFNELLNEKNIYEKEMKRMKTKLNDSLNKINLYKKKEEEMKTIYDLIKKKDFKIKILERQLTIFSNNSDETVQKLEEQIISKDKIIKMQEREIKFRNLNDNYIKLEKEKEKDEKLSQISGNSHNINLKNFQQINKKHIELYQIYFEMKQKGINSTKYYINNVLKKLGNSNSISDNKLIFIDSLINLFHIEDMETKYLFINLANKEFAKNKSLSNIKSNQISILDELFNKKHKSNSELKQILTSNEETITKMKNLFEKYDPYKRGFISFYEMIEIIKELKLDNIKEEILLYTKSEIFDKMNYSKLLLLTNSSSELEDSIHQLNNKLTSFVNAIKKDKTSLNDYISYLKENISIKKSMKEKKNEESNIEVINLENLAKFFSIKNIELDRQDIDLLKQLYGVDEILLGYQSTENTKYLNYIEYNKIVNKLGAIMKNEASETNADTQKTK